MVFLPALRRNLRAPSDDFRQVGREAAAQRMDRGLDYAMPAGGPGSIRDRLMAR